MAAKKEKKTQAADVHVVVVLDRSGSMNTIWKDTLGGYEHFRTEQVQAGKDLGATTWWTLTAFDTVYDVVHDRVEAELGHIPKSIHPRGSTALLDAVGRTIEKVKASSHGEKVVFLILTDGQENASVEFKKDAVRRLVEAQTVEGWEFVYIGASLDAYGEASGLGVVASNTVAATHSGATTVAAYATMSASTLNLRTGNTPTMAWSDDDKKKLEKDAR